MRLQRRRHRPRVGDVVAQVRPVVDAGRDEVEALLEEKQEHINLRLSTKVIGCALLPDGRKNLTIQQPDGTLVTEVFDFVFEIKE